MHVFKRNQGRISFFWLCLWNHLFLAVVGITKQMLCKMILSKLSHFGLMVNAQKQTM